MTHWWSCHHYCCGDRVQQSECIEDVVRDRDAHIAAAHPGWQPTPAEMHVSSWPTLTTTA